MAILKIRGVDPCLLIVDTTKAGSASNTFVLPLPGVGSYDYMIDWGDGTIEHKTGNTDETHVYGASGTYTITIRGVFPRVYFNNVGDCLKLTGLQLGRVGWMSFSHAFHGCANLSQFLPVADTSQVTDMSYMFYNCPCQFDLGWFDTSQVTNMSYMFRNCQALNQSVENFNTARVTDMSYMFYNCRLFNQPLANFNTALVTNMSHMFDFCIRFNQSVASFNTACVTDMSYMFYSCGSFNQPVANFDTSLVTDMTAMFRNCSVFNQSVANFNTARVTSMTGMFDYASQFKQSLATFDMHAVAGVGGMCYNCNLNPPGTTTNYDATLISWAAQSLIHSLGMDFGVSKYSAGAAATARQSIINNELWTIQDGGVGP